MQTEPNGEKCAVCGAAGGLTDCEYYRRGFGAVCPNCCEKCHDTEPFPCREYEKRREQNKERGIL